MRGVSRRPSPTSPSASATSSQSRASCGPNCARSGRSGARRRLSRTTRRGRRTPARARPGRPTGSRQCPRRSTLPSAVPRLVAEGAFLVVVALLAGLADLSAVWIALVMLARLGPRRALRVGGRGEARPLAPRRGRGAAPRAAEYDLDTTGPWDMPVVQATAIENADASESRTVVARLATASRRARPTPRRRWRPPRAPADGSGSGGERRSRRHRTPGRRKGLPRRGGCRDARARAGGLGASSCSGPEAAAGLRRRALRDGAETADGARVRP